MGKKSSSIFGNKGLEPVFASLVEQVSNKYSVIVRQLGEDRAEEVQFNRFLNNEKVTPKRLVDHYWKNSNASFEGKHLLVISDTTTLSFSPIKNREYLGYLAQNTKKEGFDLHPAIMVDAQDGGCYGLGGIHTYRNEKKVEQVKSEPKSKTKRRSAYADKPFEENNRFKWFDAPNQAIKNCPRAASYTLIGDRESDMYDLIIRTINKNWQFLYRCQTNRKVKGDHEKLYETIDSWEVQHSYDLDLAATKDRSAHQAKLDVKFGTVSIKRPRNHPDKNLADHIEIGVIEVKEQLSSVVGDQEPVHWRLLTSHSLDNIEKVLQIVQWYCWRWMIEQLFRAAKSKGLDIENAVLKTFHGLANLGTITLLAAIQVIQLVQARGGKTAQRIEDCFDKKEQECLEQLNEKLEGKTDKQKNPHPSYSLAFGTWVIARLGGWKGYAKRRPPGPITITRGLNRFYSIVEGYYLRL